MTSIYYDDCFATSPNGKFTLEARSPHNGTINYKDGTSPKENDFKFEYRVHQSSFRYQLLVANKSASAAEAKTGNIIWERWQDRGEASPRELIVSDSGWTIIRTHGFQPEVIAISPTGDEVLRVEIHGAEKQGVTEPVKLLPQAANTRIWHADQLQFTTAGTFWAQNSCRYFFQLNQSDYFVWRTFWGQRLAIDLTNAEILSEAEQEPLSICHAIQKTEADGAYTLLSELVAQFTEIQQLLNQRSEVAKDSHRLVEKLRQMKSAIHIAGVHRVTSCIPLLRILEEIDCPDYSTSSTAMGTNWDIQVQHFRPILHHTLRLLGEEPLGFATYYFHLSDKSRFVMPERVTDRNIKAGQVTKQMTAEQVLQLLGSPDHVKKVSREVDKRFQRPGFGKRFQWTEFWEYDFLICNLWETFCISWEQDGRDGKISQIATAPSSWLQSSDRESEILQWF